ncbi:MAG: hypothetical protein V9E94_16795 [Microthrixaceae bacterium]
MTARANRSRRVFSVGGPQVVVERVTRRRVVEGEVGHGRHDPFTHPGAQLRRGRSGEGDDEEVGCGDVAFCEEAGGERRKGVGLAGPGTGLERQVSVGQRGEQVEVDRAGAIRGRSPSHGR